MTAEVAILNKQCVVLASDSAVTTGDSKIFNTVNKLFALSKHEPVGIMAYSSAEVMGVPIETVIKEFRRSQGNTHYDHLEDYAEAFKEFLSSDDKTLFDDDSRIQSMQHIVWRFFNTLETYTWQNLKRHYKNWGHPSKVEARKALTNALEEIEKTCINGTSTIEISNKTRVKKLLVGAVGTDVENALKTLRTKFPVSNTLGKHIRGLAIEQFFHTWSCGGDTGFVIAGFGRQDIFPRLRSFEFSCAALGIHKISPFREADISRENFGVIFPFAQRDVMRAFIEGKDSFYDDVISGVIGAFFAEKEKIMRQTMPQNRKEIAQMKALGTEVQKVLQEQLSEVTQDRFINPLMDIVASMPKEEVAILAESLINLTSLKRKASKDAETVGGPTDVAVISKGDGFIWIKRKHYFDPKLNPQFTSMYMQGDKS